jgi:hypothetical protein
VAISRKVCLPHAVVDRPVYSRLPPLCLGHPRYAPVMLHRIVDLQRIVWVERGRVVLALQPAQNQLAADRQRDRDDDGYRVDHRSVRERRRTGQQRNVQIRHGNVVRLFASNDFGDLWNVLDDKQHPPSKPDALGPIHLHCRPSASSKRTCTLVYTHARPNVWVVVHKDLNACRVRHREDGQTAK